MKVTDVKQLRTGMKVRCKIDDVNIDDAKVYIDDDFIHICQNELSGYNNSPDLFGYRYSWGILYFYPDIYDLEIIGNRELEHMVVGDILVDESGDEIKVLEVLENSFLRSYWDDFNTASQWYTFTQAKKYGWKIKQDETIEEPKKEIEVDGYTYVLIED